MSNQKKQKTIMAENKSYKKINKKAILFCFSDIRSYTCLKDYTVLKPGKLNFLLTEYKVTFGTTYFNTIMV